MSSTKRGAQRSEADNYPTPAWAFRRMLETGTMPKGRYLEPCAGDGTLIRTAMERAEWTSGIEWHAVELRAKMRPILETVSALHSVRIADFLDPETCVGEYYDAIVTNPPFSLAFEILQKSMAMSRNVYLLLRLNFFGSAWRHSFLTEHMPKTVWILPNRPSFNGAGKTDSIEYAWFHWELPYKRTFSETRILGLTSKEERRADMPLIVPDDVASQDAVVSF